MSWVSTHRRGHTPKNLFKTDVIVAGQFICGGFVRMNLLDTVERQNRNHMDLGSAGLLSGTSTCT
jgi:hypothetical protein